MKDRSERVGWIDVQSGREMERQQNRI